MLDEEKRLIGRQLGGKPISVHGSELNSLYPPGYWSWTVGDGPEQERELMREKFRQAATEAGILITSPNASIAVQPSIVWFQRLFEFCQDTEWEDLREFHSQNDGPATGAHIDRACEASTLFCVQLHRRHLEREASASKTETKEGTSTTTETTQAGNPWAIWERNKELPNASATQRLHAACKVFTEKMKTHILENRDLWKIVTVQKQWGLSSERSEPDPNQLMSAFYKHCRWFLGELSETFIDHVGRRGLAGQAGIAAFEEYFMAFTVIALENNWRWGLRYLHIYNEENDGFWPSLVQEVSDWKLYDLHKLWNVPFRQTQTDSTQEVAEVDPIAGITEVLAEASMNASGGISTALIAAASPVPEPRPKRIKRAPDNSVKAQLRRVLEKFDHPPTFEEIAEGVDIDPTNVSRHFSGKTNPSRLNLIAYSKYFSKLLGKKVVIRKMQLKRS